MLKATHASEDREAVPGQSRRGRGEAQGIQAADHWRYQSAKSLHALGHDSRSGHIQTINK
jgi:hypothetical protein